MRTTSGCAVLVALGLLLPAAAGAQRDRDRQAAQREVIQCRAAPGGTQQGLPPRAQGYDVVVNVPELCVERIRLDVDNVEARLALHAAVANLVRVNAGAEVSIGDVQLGINGVRAEALLLVDLDNVVAVVERALAFVDAHPEIVSQLRGTVQRTIGTVGGVTGAALRPGGVVDQAVGAAGRTLENVTQPGGLLTQTVNTLGQTVQTTLDQTGNLVERTLDTAGQVVSTRTLGSVTTLPLVRTATDAAGQTVRTVRHASGALIEYTLDQAGRVTGARVVQQAPRN
jgi:YD repeat-containing protein